MESLPAPIVVDEERVLALARSLERFQFAFDGFTDPLLYPPEGTDPSRVASFFFFMVAIDHRTQIGSLRYTGSVQGVVLQDAELLWALGKRLFDTDPISFTATSMARVSTERLAGYFRLESPIRADIPGADERAALWRDAGQVLISGFGGSIMTLVESCDSRLIRPDGCGFLQLLERFRAYTDPLKKKSLLLAKFFERRGLLHVDDHQNVHVPVDNILQRIALRTGIVHVQDDELSRTIRGGVELSESRVTEVRAAVSDAFDRVALEMGLSPLRLDDLLWEFGRVYCLLPNPSCLQIPDEPSRRVLRLIRSGPMGPCPFGAGCQGYKNPSAWDLREPVHPTSFY